MHALSQLPILVISDKYELIQSYGNTEYLLPYYQLIKNLKIPLDADLTFYEGLFEESFLIFPASHHFISIGPFYLYLLDEDYREKIVERFLERYSFKEKEELLNYMSTVPCFSINQIRSLMITIDAFFQTTFEQNCQQTIRNMMQKAQVILAEPQFIANLELENVPSFHLPNALNHLNHIINLVKLGNTSLLKEEINRIPLFGISNSSISILRAEKNLSVIYLTKLLELSFTENTDVAKNDAQVKQFLKMTEEATNPVEVLRIRAAAILSFSESLANKSISDKRQMYNSILHYVNNHLYSKLRVSDIANHLYISESHLRLVFKKYSDISLQSHILKAKIQEAKLLLKRGMPVGEVAKVLHFYDMTHFLKTFKKYTGMSSKEFLNKQEKHVNK